MRTEPILTSREKFLVENLMKTVSHICTPNNPAYYDLVARVIGKHLENGTIITDNARQTINSILEKIAFAKMSDELEDILAMSDEEIEETTQAQSMAKSKSINSKSHIAILDLLSKSQEPLSRSEIANRTGLRLSAVCARVAELIEAGDIQTLGKKLDEESDRMVEILGLK